MDSLSTIFQDFFRAGVRQTFYISLFILLYKLGDNIATALSTPFYFGCAGFSKTTIGTTVKFASLWSSIFGGFVGGASMFSVSESIKLLCFFLVPYRCYLSSVFALSKYRWKRPTVLFWVVSFEYLGVGLGTTAFVVLLHKKQILFMQLPIALLTSLMDLQVSQMQQPDFSLNILVTKKFFYLCTLLAIPGMILLLVVAPFSNQM